MKTYLLRDPKTVEPQNPWRHEPAVTATVEVILGRSAAPPTGRVLFIGLDVHNDSIAVSLAPSDSTEVRRYGIIGGEHDDVLKLLKKLQAAHPDTQLRCCYEAGPRGYPLCRFIRAHGHECLIVSPSKVPRKPGDRVKTDRRDADQLARLFRAGELTGIYVPDPQDEAVRDLIRARFQVSKQQHRARQQLKMFLLRHNIRYAGTTSWTPAHLRFLATVKMPFAEQQFVFQEMVNSISEAGQRLERYAAQLPRVVAGWRWEPVVRALMSLRGLALLNAATLVAELGDLHRFATAGQLMSYLGLVPSEDTTSDDRKQGGITKMGNGIARRALIEAAWHYRQPARISRGVLARQQGIAQGGDRRGVGGPEPIAPSLQTPGRGGTQEAASGGGGFGPRVVRICLGHRTDGQAARAQALSDFRRPAGNENQNPKRKRDHDIARETFLNQRQEPGQAQHSMVV